MKEVYAVLILATTLALLAIFVSEWPMVTRSLLVLSAGLLYVATFLGISAGIKMSERNSR